MGGERRYGLRVAVLWALFFIMTAGTELGSGLTEAMLLARLGASNLGAAFILEALLRLGSTAGYLWFADRVRAGALFRGISWVNLAAGLALAGALAADLPGSVLLFYGAVRVLENILVLHWGVYLVDFFSVRETTRAFPVIYSAGRVASFAAGAALSGIAGASSAAWGVGLYLVSGAALLGLVSLIPEAAGAPGGNGGGSGRRRGTLQGLAEGWRYTVRTPLVRAMILASVAMVLMRRLLDSALGVRMEELFADEAALGRYIAVYMMLASAASFLVQALAAGPLLARLGTTFVNLGYAWATLVSALGLILAPGVVTVTAGRIAGRELKDVFKTPVTLIHYATFPDAFRGRVRSVIFGLSIPLATLASGLLLVGLEQAGGLAGRRLDLLVLAAGLLFVLASAAQNRGYRLSLVELLLERVGPGGPSAPGGEVSDGRILQVRAARRSPLYLVRRRWIAARFSLDLGDPEADPGEPARRRAVEDLMILVELYRPRGEGDLRGLLLAALEDPRREVQDTAYMVVRGILPHRYARLARRLFRSPRPGGTP